MSLRNKIAEMLIVGFSGCVLTQDSPIMKELEALSLGGVILFDQDMQQKTPYKNIKNKEQIKQLTQSLQSFAMQKQALPLFIAIDYEGGAVDRLQHVPHCMKTQSAYEQGMLSEDDLFNEASNMAKTLADLGFNLNFAPVVDLHFHAEQGIIGSRARSFSSSFEKVIRAASTFVQAFHHAGIICCYKHFPGHGSAQGDTHLSFVDVSEHFIFDELKPYFSLLRDKNALSSMVMTAHVINRQLDKEGLPATLSYPIITELLRREIGFNGVVISDDLQMHAISQHFGLAEAVRRTINAGSDMLIFGNQWGEHRPSDIVDCIEQEVLAGRIASSRIEEAYQRIVQLKSTLLK